MNILAVIKIASLYTALGLCIIETQRHFLQHLTTWTPSTSVNTYSHIHIHTDAAGITDRLFSRPWYRFTRKSKAGCEWLFCVCFCRFGDWVPVLVCYILTLSCFRQLPFLQNYQHIANSPPLYSQSRLEGFSIIQLCRPSVPVYKPVSPSAASGDFRAETVQLTGLWHCRPESAHSSRPDLIYIMSTPQ